MTFCKYIFRSTFTKRFLFFFRIMSLKPVLQTILNHIVRDIEGFHTLVSQLH